MNKTRRKEIATLRQKFEELTGDLESIRDEERETFDNMPEGLQNGEKGQAIDAAAMALESAYDSLQELVGYLEEAAS